MANLILPHRFVPGQLALASEMNANFEAIETWAGGNLGTTNITVLEARPGGGSILEFNQTANFPVLDVTNSGADTAIDITQAGLLQTGKAVIDITDNNPQAAANTAHFRMTLSNSTDIPAIEVKHGPTQNTLTVTRTGITTDVGITTAGTLTANSLSLTQPLSLTGPFTVTAESADALAIKIKGRSSDNTSKVELKSNNDSTTYASITGSTSGINLNLPDTADSYTFTIGNPPVTKAVIDNSGIDGQYLKTASVPITALAQQSNSVFIGVTGQGPYPPPSGGGLIPSWYVYRIPSFHTDPPATYTMTSVSFTVTKPYAYVGVQFETSGYFNTESIGYQRDWAVGPTVFVEMGGIALTSYNYPINGGLGGSGVYNSPVINEGTTKVWLFPQGTYTANLKVTIQSSDLMTFGSPYDRTYRAYEIKARITEL